MKKMLKRAVSLLLVAVMLLPALAAGETKTDFAVSDMEAAAGSTIQIPVSVSNNSGFGSTTFSFTIPDGWTLNDILLYTDTADSVLYDDLSGRYPVSNYNPTPNVARKTLTVAAGIRQDFTGNGVMCWLDVTLPGSDSIVDGDYEIGISADSVYSARDPYTDIISNFTFTAGTVTVTGGITEASLTPAISSQPVGAVYTYADPAPAVTPLTVEAAVATEGTLSFQWYRENGDADVSVGTGSSFTPELPAVGSSESYYCVVTNTYNGVAYSVTSEAAVITYEKADRQPPLAFVNADTVTYGQTLTLGVNHSGDVTYTVTAGTGSAALSGTTLTPTAVGTVTAGATLAGDECYNEATAQQVITIHPADLVLTGAASYAVTVYTTGKTVALTLPTAAAVDGAAVSASWTVSGKVVLDQTGSTVRAADDAVAGDTATLKLTYSAANHNSVTVTYTVTVADRNDISDQIGFTAVEGAGASYDGSKHPVSDFVNEADIPEGYEGDVTYTVTDSEGNVVAEGTDLDELTVTDAGQYTVTVTYEDGENQGSKELTFSIARAEVAEPTAVAGLIYNGSGQTGVTGIAATVEWVSGHAIEQTNAGDYVSVFALIDEDNYQWAEGSDGTVEWSIARRSIAVPAAAEGLVYTGKTLTGVPAANDGSYTVTGSTAVDAGSYTATVTPTANHQWDDGTTGAKTVAWTIAPQPIDVSGVKFEQDDITYDGQPHTVAVSGLPDHVTVTYGGDCTATDAGVYTATAALAAASGNYELSGTASLTLTWKILRASVAVSDAPVIGEDLVYNGRVQTGVTWQTGKGYTVTGTLTATDAGDYTAAASLDRNHCWADGSTEDLTLEWTISPAEVTAPGQAADQLYDGSTKTGYTAGELYEITGTNSAANAGTYTVTLSLKDGDNYVWADTKTADDKDYTWTITKAAAQTGLTMEESMRYDSGSKTIDAETFITGGSVTVTSVTVTGGQAAALVKAENADNDVKLTLSDSITREDAGKTALIEVEFTTPNYDGTNRMTVTLTITSKTDVSGQISYAGGEVTYNGEAQKPADPTFSGTPSGTPVWTYVCKDSEGNVVPEMKDAGVYTVTVTYEDDNNYGTARPVTFTIKQADVTITGLSADDKVYDGTAAAAVTGTAVVSGAVRGDDVSVSAGTAAFGNGNVGKNKTVTFSGYTLTGADAPNYRLTAQPASVEADINARNLTITGVEAVERTYNGSTSVELTGGTLVGVIDGDDVSFVLGTGTMSTPNAGPANPVTTNITLTGSDAGNYTLTQPTDVTAHITAIALEKPTGREDILTYTGMNQTGCVTPDGLTDFVNAAGMFAVDAGDYTTTFTLKNTTNYTWEDGSTEPVVIRWTIEPAELTVVSVTVSDKVYDGTAEAEVTAVELSGLVPGETLRKGRDFTVEAVFDSADAGEDKSVTVTLTLADTDTAANYVLSSGTFAAVAGIAKADPEGKPDYDHITSSGKTLADANLTVGSITVEGTVKWVDGEGNELPGDTEVEQGQSYTWIFLPADGDNYNTLTGSVVLFRSSARPPFVPVDPDTGDTDDGEDEGDDESGDAPVFDDVTEDDWFCDEVTTAVKEGLFNGVSDSHFAPNGSMTRAMVVTVLWRMHGQPACTADSFDDVLPGSWYETAVAWASSVGVVNGVGDNLFAPDQSVTREQLAAILYRYAALLKLDTSASADLTAFADGHTVSPYARDAMSWAVANGLINGVGSDLLAPAGTATRAQVAAILVRFMEQFGL